MQTTAISFVINCDSQDEIDYYWEKLTADGGRPVECGWLKDKYDLSWQIVPLKLWDFMLDENPARAQRVVRAPMQMTKLDLAKLEAAYRAD